MVWRDWLNTARNKTDLENNKTSAVSHSESAESLAWSLEPRMLFDGAIAATVNDTAVAENNHSETTADASKAAASEAHSTSSAQDNNSVAPADSGRAQNDEKSAQADVAAPAEETVRHEVAFIDTSLKDYQTLVDGVKPGVEVVLIDGSKDGLAQIADWAASHSGYDAMHIFSHGSEGKINLGSNVLSSSSLSSDAVQAALATIGNALNSDGDILLYGCDVGASSSGDALLTGLASATGADVAASTNATGSSLIGGDWTLEKTVGTVETAALHMEGYQGLLEVLVFSVSETGSFPTSITRSVDGTPVTFSSAADGNLDVEKWFSTAEVGLFSATQGGLTQLNITVPTGYTFDLTALRCAGRQI
ncbi:DUF4347 domain-containing protein [Phytobacter sp. V91]|uniref:DUF4347 domain-containing protein n=1 Tax=Phytobacter sp. V91 TaxID=3369425 RepID=UPI003F640A57